MSREERAHANRTLMAEHMPDCLRLIDELKARGMFGRVVSFHVEQMEKSQ